MLPVKRFLIAVMASLGLCGRERTEMWHCSRRSRSLPMVSLVNLVTDLQMESEVACRSSIVSSTLYWGMDGISLTKQLASIGIYK